MLLSRDDRHWMFGVGVSSLSFCYYWITMLLLLLTLNVSFRWDLSIHQPDNASRWTLMNKKKKSTSIDLGRGSFGSRWLQPTDIHGGSVPWWHKKKTWRGSYRCVIWIWLNHCSTVLSEGNPIINNNYTVSKWLCSCNLTSIFQTFMINSVTKLTLV